MEELSQIPWGLIAPLLVLQFVLAIVVIIDINRIHETRGPKWIWILVALFINTLGPVAYFLFGRKSQ